jgi:predicted ferric reductase
MPNKNQIWIAGGIGITPFLSMARALQNDNYNIDLYYCTSNKGEAVLLDELLKISSVFKNFRVIQWCSDEKGRINAHLVSRFSGLENKSVLLCGPPPFMSSLRKQFLELNVVNNNIYSEKFQFI